MLSYVICAAFPGRPEKVTAWKVAGRLLPHALAVTDQPDSLNAEPETTAILLSRAARYLWGRAENSRLSRSPWNFGGGPMRDQAASSLVGVTAAMVWSRATRSAGKCR